MRTEKNIRYHKWLYMDLFLPEQEEFFTIIYFHGGGLVEGDKGDTHQFCEHLAKKGYAVATANYSLLKEAKFPEMLYDAAKAVKFIKDKISKYGKSKGLIVMGQSAGAWITLMLCLNKDYLQSVDINNNEITAWISDSAQTTTHFNILKLEQDLDPMSQRIDEAAPLFYTTAETSFNHLLLLAYEQDMPNRVEQNRLLLSTLKNFNQDLDVELKILHGCHCHGSGELDEDNEYEVIKTYNIWAKTRIN